MVEFNMSSDVSAPDIKVQNGLIQIYLGEKLVLGQTWYIIDYKWFKMFKLYVGMNSSESCNVAEHPGPIDNSQLLDDDLTTLKKDLVENLDYFAVSSSVWNHLYKWYGLMENQQPIGRSVINLADPPIMDLRIEVYRIKLNLFNNVGFVNPVVHAFSSADQIFKIEEVCREKFSVPAHHRTQLRCFYGSKKSQVLLNPNNNLHQESLNSSLKIVLEVVKVEEACSSNSFVRPAVPKSRDLSKIPRAIQLNNNRPSTSHGFFTQDDSDLDSSSSAEGRGPPCVPGLSGLANLGNTCFLNSIVQCLSNCKPLTQYFLDKIYKKELNTTNPLGKGGKIAKSFADVISMIWSGKFSTTVPHHFKMQLTKFAPQFIGYQQHDAQELLTFILDGLHEDLNRVKVWSYQQSEDKDLDDDELARISWENFLRRNDSIIIDHFHGMLKSVVVCPSCEKVSIKFDTFSTLSLPLPEDCDRSFKVRYFPYNQTMKVLDLLVVVPKKGIVQDLMMEVARITRVRFEHIVLAELNKSHFQKFFAFNDPLDLIDDKAKIVVYDLPEELMNGSSRKYTLVPVVLWEIDDPLQYVPFLSSLFGIPFIILLPQGRIYFKELYDSICERMFRSCEGFLKANNNHGAFSMEYESADGSQGCSNGDVNMFKVFRVSTQNYNEPHHIFDEEDDMFEVPEFFGRNVLAIQIEKETHLRHYMDPTPEYKDYTDGHNRPVLKPTLENCLELFISPEKLGVNNAWYCPCCKRMQRATKKLNLWKLPNIIIFHLKRFAFNETCKEKLGVKVEFPLTGLNINRYVVNKHKENLLYDLIGVCNHFGSLGCGHYTANCKNVNDGKWYCFDDNSVYPILAESVQTEHAYVLFYQRRPPVRADPEEEKVDL